MNICDGIILVRKDVDVTKGLPSPHRLEDLTVDEVSLVTEPAILTSEESKAHKGFIVAKLGDEKDRVPAAIRKAVDTLDGEDLGAAVQRLAAVCRKRLLADTGDAESYYMSPLKVYKDHVMMGFWWDDDAATLAASGRVAYYNCYYTQDSVTKEFTVTRSAGLVVSMQETAAVQSKLAGEPEAAPEVPAAEVAPVPEATPEAPAVEAAPEVPVASEPEAPAVEAEPAAPEAAAPVVEAPATEAAPEVAAPVVEAPAVESTTKMSEVLSALVAIGKSFEVDVSPEGKATIRVVEKSATPAQPTGDLTEVERMRRERDDAVKGADELRKKLAKTVSDDPPTDQEIGGVQKNNQIPEVSAFGQAVAAGIAQTRMEN